MDIRSVTKHFLMSAIIVLTLFAFSACVSHNDRISDVTDDYLKVEDGVFPYVLLKDSTVVNYKTIVCDQELCFHGKGTADEAMGSDEDFLKHASQKFPAGTRFRIIKVLRIIPAMQVPDDASYRYAIIIELNTFPGIHAELPSALFTMPGLEFNKEFIAQF